MEAVFAYAEHQRCRSQMLLAYFDEDPTPANAAFAMFAWKKSAKATLPTRYTDNITLEIVQLLQHIGTPPYWHLLNQYHRLI
jgi:ATP-dependent DNA helicase RecQ